MIVTDSDHSDDVHDRQSPVTSYTKVRYMHISNNGSCSVHLRASAPPAVWEEEP